MLAASPLTNLRISAHQRVEHEDELCQDKGRSISCPIALLDAKDRKSTRLNSSHVKISYAVFCLKKKKLIQEALEVLSCRLLGGGCCNFAIIVFIFITAGTSG